MVGPFRFLENQSRTAAVDCPALRLLFTFIVFLLRWNFRVKHSLFSKPGLANRMPELVGRAREICEVADERVSGESAPVRGCVWDLSEWMT
jgi:hypothetical protein